MSNLTIDFSGLRKAAARTNQSASPTNQVVGGSMLEALTPEELARMFPAGSKMNTMASTSSIVSGGGPGRPVGGGGGAGGAVSGSGRGSGAGHGSGSGGGAQKVPAWIDALESATGSNIRNAASTGGVDRSKFKEEFEKNPAVMAQLFSLAKAEVGSQGPKAIQMWMETVFNRAHARGRSIAFIISPDSESPSYWPKGQHRPKLTENEMKEYGKHFKEVMEGSNLTDYATDNASSDLAVRREKSGRRGRWENGEFFYTDFHYKDAMDKLRKETDTRLAQKQKEQELASIGVDASAVPTVKPGDNLSLPPPGIDSSFITEWDKLSDAQKKEFYNSLFKLGGVEKFNELWAQNKDKTAREVAAGTLAPGVKVPDGEERVVEKQSSAIRNLPVKKDIKEAINYALEKSEGLAGGKLEFHVVSGTQHKHGPKPKGASNRHEHGAADGDIYVVNSDGTRRKLDSRNPKDREIVANITKHIYEVVPGAGVGGFDPNKSHYMGGSRLHIGGPNHPGGKATPPWHAPKEVRDAAAEGLQARQKNAERGIDPLAEWKKGKEEAVAAAKAKKESTQASAAGPAPASPSVSDSPAPGTPGAITTPTPNSGPRTNAKPKAETPTPTAPPPAAATPVPRFGSENATPPRTESTPPAPATPPQQQNPATDPTVPVQPQSQQEAAPAPGGLQAGTLDAVAPSASAQRAYMQATKLKEDDNHFSMGGYNSRQA